MNQTKSRFLSDLEKSSAWNEWEAIDEQLRKGVILCEGLRDARALSAYGYRDTLTASGRTYQLGPILVRRKVSRVIILTDMDTRGEELARELESELARYSITCDRALRKRIAALLRLRYFEEFGPKFEEFKAQTER